MILSACLPVPTPPTSLLGPRELPGVGWWARVAGRQVCQGADRPGWGRGPALSDSHPLPVQDAATTVTHLLPEQCVTVTAGALRPEAGIPVTATDLSMGAGQG